MFFPTEVTINTCVEYLQAGYRSIYGDLNPDYADAIAKVAKTALQSIATSDALYHNVEHTILVTLAGQEILKGKQIREGNVSCQEWLQVIISLLCHDIGYVKGACCQDNLPERLFDKGINGELVSLPFGSTDASLTPYHVDRSKLFVKETLADFELIDTTAIEQYIELTRFPAPKDSAYTDTINYPGLVRAADLIGQLSDPRYLEKMPALFYEFEETGANKFLGYSHPEDLRAAYPKFFWNVVYQYIEKSLPYLEVTEEGRTIIANLYRNVAIVQEENQNRFFQVKFKLSEKLLVKKVAICPTLSQDDYIETNYYCNPIVGDVQFLDSQQERLILLEGKVGVCYAAE